MNIDRIPGSEKPNTPSGILRQELPEDPRLETPLSRRSDLNAALPNLVLGSCYLLAFRDILPFLNKHWLGAMMAIEVLAIHSFPFMMLISAYSPTTEKGKKLQRIGFWGLLGMYFIFAAQMGGLGGMIAFAGLTVTTYLGYLLRRTSPGAIAQLVIRWLTALLAFMVSSGASRMPGRWMNGPGIRRCCISACRSS